jgi:hypothetical protein
MGMERGPLALVSTIEALLGRKSSGSGLENREYGRRDPLCRPCNILYPQNVALNLPKSSGRSVSIVHSRPNVLDFFAFYLLETYSKNELLGNHRTKHNYDRLFHVLKDGPPKLCV